MPSFRTSSFHALFPSCPVRLLRNMSAQNNLCAPCRRTKLHLLDSVAGAHRWLHIARIKGNQPFIRRTMAFPTPNGSSSTEALYEMLHRFDPDGAPTTIRNILELHDFVRRFCLHSLHLPPADATSLAGDTRARSLMAAIAAARARLLADAVTWATPGA